MPAWFRFYNEAIDDRKLKHIARATRQPLISVIGAWSVLMALANNDHERGYLLLTADTPFKLEDLYNEIADGMDPDDVALMIAKFQQMGLMAYDDELGAYYLPAFSKRQYESDNSTERVRRYRERQAALQEENGNGDVTLQERDGNAPETETETESETEKKELTDAGASTPNTFEQWLALVENPPNGSNRPAVLKFMFETLYPGRDPPDYGYIGKVARTVGGAGRLAQLLWDCSSRPPTGDVMRYVQGVAKGQKKSNPRRRPASQVVKDWVEKEGIEWQQRDVSPGS